MDKPYKAFILAAGFGTRMRPITEEIPKPLVEVNGHSLLWRTLDNLRDFGIREVVVNAHYLAEKIYDSVSAYMAQRADMRVHVSFEKEILDTGGGIVNALDFFDKNEPFFVIAGDNLWVDNVAGNGFVFTHTYTHALERLARGWDERKMDIFTLMQPVSSMNVTMGVGDYDFSGNDGGVRRNIGRCGSHMWTNIRLNHPRIYQNADKKSFSFLEIMDEAERCGRLFALEHEGEWHHISTPDDLVAVNAHIKALEGRRR